MAVRWKNWVRFLLEVTESVESVWGAERVGTRLSPGGAFNDMAEPTRKRFLFICWVN
jgi:2,4-dienoyl-CoA reductase-like NADH-dependent reductase (Old Yellow Enzyme family)